MTAPAPTILRITNGRQGKLEAAVVRSRAFRLTTEEAQAAPDLGTGMYRLMLFIVFVFYAYVLSDHV